ncbi:hypothetical protein BJ165DRAFT_437391 [Panaeolus papilionaceus]|nr:hypothetical protein BJ165DRAFT_437391 [Panaeolus papilionaceus]
MRLSTSLVVLFSLLGAFATNPAQVLSDIASISSQATALQNNLQALSPNNLVGAWGVHTGARGMLAALKSAADNAKVATNRPISDSERAQILTASDGLGTTIIATMNELVAKKDIIQNFPVPGSASVARQDLSDLKAGSDNYQQTLLRGAQGDAKALAIIDSVNKAINDAVAAYST